MSVEVHPNPSPKPSPTGAELGIFSKPPKDMKIKTTVRRVERYAPELEKFLAPDDPVFRPLLHTGNSPFGFLRVPHT